MNEDPPEQALAPTIEEALSHELRNPLSPILNTLTILRRMRTNDLIIDKVGNIVQTSSGGY